MAVDPAQAKTLRELISSSGITVRVGGGPSGQVAEPAGRLGAGGMGEVLRVRDGDLGREIAAKVIKGQVDPGVLAKFIQEAQVTGQLGHPNIVPVHELGLTPDRQVYFTMKQVEGDDLAALLAREREAEGSLVARERGGARPSRGRLVADLALVRRKYVLKMLTIFLKVCDALSFAHSKGVIHRDLKPSNIMVGRFGEVQVMDWGLAKLVGQPDPVADGCRLDLGEGRIAELARGKGPLKTMDGAVAGTPAYMPPEQARGEIDRLDHRADVYALGTILYEVLTLELPFEGDNAWNLLRQVIEGELVPPGERTPEREIPWELEAVVRRAMAREPADRYATVADLGRDIESYLEGRALQAAEYSGWQLLQKWAARNKAAAFAVLGVSVALLVGFAASYWQMRKAQAAREGEKQQRIAAQKNEKKARDNEKKAEAEKEKVKDREKKLAREKARADERLLDFESMSDLKLIVELRDRRADLGPQGWKLKALGEWLDKAREMSGRLPRHAAVVQRLERKTPRSAPEEWQLGLVRKLVVELRAFVEGIAQVEGWEAAARAAAARKTRDPGRWAAAIAAIKAEPKYRGLALKIQEGLLPLGPDPKSGLWEFAHLPSGKPPVRERGRWQITGQTCVVLVLLPGGTFKMGASDGDAQVQGNEKTAHDVKLAPLFVSKYELTQGQWQRLTGKNPSKYRPPMRIGQPITLAHPVEQVTWIECRRVLARAGLALPTEAQWEYAARAGTRTTWWTGNDPAALKAAGNLACQTLQAAARQFTAERWSDGHAVHAPVGRFGPNRFGLHDVIGNVFEWCRDPFVEDAYGKLPARLPEGWRDYPDDAFRGARVNRGGGWSYPAFYARSASRYWTAPASRSVNLGCRPARGVH